MVRLIIIVLILGQVLSCSTAIEEEKYVAEQYPFIDGNIEILVYATGNRVSTGALQVREVSPYQIHIKFRTKDESIGTLRLVSVDVPGFLDNEIIGDEFTFGTPSKNPHVLGYRFLEAYSSIPIDIEFEKIAEFDIIISYNLFLGGRMVNKEVNVKMKKKFVQINQIMASIMGV